MALSVHKKIEMEFGASSAESDDIARIARGNVARMARRLPRALIEDRKQEVREICTRLKAFAEALEEPSLAELVSGFADLPEQSGSEEREQRLQTLDMLVAEWEMSADS